MDPIDILGGLLGQKGSGGLGTKILKDLIGGAARRSQPQVQPQGQNRSEGHGVGHRSGQGTSRGGSVEDLEDLLNVARDRRGGGAPTAPRAPAPPRAPQPAPPRPHDERHEHHHEMPPWNTPIGQVRFPRAPQDQNEQAIILSRAMINAAKADGQVTQDEQQNLINQVGGASPQAIQFLRDEFSRPLDVREFAWSVPMGMEEQVYSMSLSSIDLDTRPEADYLRELAHGLRIPPEVCNQIHHRLGAPPLYS
ncbi:MAG: tellurite resistance TerB family protein [Planctomycetales bacterium]|nr:tellurite resistance TerB family protein [Planctomycetales bacterium]